MTDITGSVTNQKAVDVSKRTCPVCDKEFEGKNNQRFCPPTEDDRKRSGPNTQPRSWCAKRYERHVSRGTPLKGQPPQPFTCRQCGKHCVQGKDGIGPNMTTYCSKRCKKAWHYEPRVPEFTARQRAARLKAKRAARDTAPRQWIMGTCRTCGDSFTAMRAASYMAHYCSKTCNAKQARTERRARKQKAWVEEVWRSVVFERDNWTCQLCGDPVDKSIKWPDTQCASLDHIIPLANGGDHSYENTQLAHFLCNSLKGDREGGSMMFAA